MRKWMWSGRGAVGPVRVLGGVPRDSLTGRGGVSVSSMDFELAPGGSSQAE
jgi:hypothetical protein